MVLKPKALFVLQEMILLKFDKRLAKYLCEYAQRTGSEKLRITQEAIATDLNMAREVVSLMLNQFEIEEMVALKRGSIEIKNLEALKNIME